MRNVTTRLAAESGLATDVEIGAHRLRGDEPVEVGGTDTGPQPHELLLAALGTCVSMTLRLYAQRKGWPLVNAHVGLAGQSQQGHYLIRQHIWLEGTLDAAQRARLLEIAGRCPVHRVLTGQTVIETDEETR